MDDLIKKEIVRTSDYEWEKHIRLTWKETDHICKANANGIIINLQNEFLGARNQCTLVYPLTESIFLSIGSAMKQLRGISINTNYAFGYETELFQEVTYICASPSRIIHCDKTYTTKQILDIVTGASLSNVWVFFEKLHNFPQDILFFLCREIQFVQQKLINSKSIQAKDFMKLFASISNDCFSDKSKKDYFSILLNTFRDISLAYSSNDIYVQSLLITKGFQEYIAINKSINAFNTELEILFPNQKLEISLRDFVKLINLGEKIRDIMLPPIKKAVLPEKRIANMKRNEEFFATDIKILPTANVNELTGKLEKKAFGSALYMLFKSICPEKKTAEEWDLLLCQIIEKCDLAHIDTKSEFNKFEIIPHTYDSLINIAKESTEHLQMESSQCLSQKIAEIYQISLINTQICVIGNQCTGKSTLLSIFCFFLSQIYQKTVNTHIVNPSSESLKELFDSENSIFHTLQKDIQASPNNYHCITCDTEMESSWIEILQSKYTFNKNTLFLYETVSLSNVSPGILSKISISYITDEILSPHMIMISSINSLYQKQNEFYSSAFIDKADFQLIISEYFGRFIGNVLDSQEKESNCSVQSCLGISFKLLNAFCSQLKRKYSQSNAFLSLNLRVNKYYF